MYVEYIVVAWCLLGVCILNGLWVAFRWILIGMRRGVFEASWAFLQRDLGIDGW